jgi:hypothetical protein
MFPSPASAHHKPLSKVLRFYLCFVRLIERNNVFGRKYELQKQFGRREFTCEDDFKMNIKQIRLGWVFTRVCKR